MATVGVVCERVRVEEKQLLAALIDAGLRPAPFPPGALPLALTPGGQALPHLLIDRGQNRVAAAAILTACRAIGTITLDAGLAARGDRLAVAAALAAAGLPRPETRLTCSATAALDTLGRFGYPATVLPVTAGGEPIAILDLDTAEAVLEHREVLGTSHEALSLIQAGAPATRWPVIVVGGVAVATMSGATGEPLPALARELAEAATVTLGAAIVAIEIARVDAGLVVWDAAAVPEFRQATAIGSHSVATAVAELAQARLTAEQTRPASEHELIPLTTTHRREAVTHGVVLTA